MKSLKMEPENDSEIAKSEGDTSEIFNELHEMMNIQ